MDIRMDGLEKGERKEGRKACTRKRRRKRRNEGMVEARMKGRSSREGKEWGDNKKVRRKKQLCRVVMKGR